MGNSHQNSVDLALTHDVMEADDINVRVYGDTAILSARGVSGGHYRGQAFRVVERVSDVWVQNGGQWKCALTHLSRIEPFGQVNANQDV